MTIFSSQGTALAYDETFGLTVKRAPCASVTIITFLRNLFLWCVSVHMNVSVHMCVGAHVYVPHAYTGQIAASNVGLQEASILFSLELGLEWLRSKTKGCTFLCPHTLKIINTNHYTWLFLWELGVKCKSSFLYSENFADRSSFLSTFLK